MFIEIILIQHFLLLLLNIINTYNYKTFFFVILCVRARVSVKGRCIEKLYVLLLDTYVCIECFFDWNVYVKTNIACNFWYIFLTISRLYCTRVYIKIKSLTMMIIRSTVKARYIATNICRIWWWTQYDVFATSALIRPF